MCLSNTQNELSYCTILVKMNLEYKRIMLYLQSIIQKGKPMDKVKTINLLSLDRLNLEEQASKQDYFRMSDDAIVIINGDIHKAQLFNKEEIYQLMEPRFLLAMQGWGDVCINLQNYHIEKGNIIITGPDTIIEVNEISDDARIAGIVFRESIEVQKRLF